MEIGERVKVSDRRVIEKYNTDTFRQTSEGDLPVYYDVGNIPADYYEDGSRIEIDDSAHPIPHDNLQRDSNFRLKYRGTGIGGNVPGGLRPRLLKRAVDRYSDDGEISNVGFSFTVPSVIIWALAVCMVTIVVSVGAYFVIAEIINLRRAISLPGGVSGQERMIGPNTKQVTHPDGSWTLFTRESEEDNWEPSKSGDEPMGTWKTLLWYAALGIGGIVVIYLVLTHLPEISKGISKAVGGAKKAGGKALKRGESSTGG